MYGGASRVTIDSKGRAAIPARYRPALVDQCAGRLVVTLDTDPCLLVYPHNVWQDFIRQLQQLPQFDRRLKVVRRHFLGYAEDLEMDRQGRLQLTPMLREKANLNREAVLVGQGEKFELWDASAWDAREDADDAVTLDDELLASLGL